MATRLAIAIFFMRELDPRRRAMLTAPLASSELDQISEASSLQTTSLPQTLAAVISSSL
jgi:hypothetical protein